MASIECCGKTFLVILNIFLILLSLMSLGGGLFLKFGQSLLPLPSSVFEQVAAFSSSSSSQSSTSLDLDDGVSSVSELTSTVDVSAYVLMALSVFLLVAGIVGCAGACCKVRALLAIYSAIVLLALVAKVAMLVFWLLKAVDGRIFDAMKDALRTKYAGPSATNVESLFLNTVMIQLKCCGIESYTDFLEAAAWNRTVVRVSAGVTHVFQQQIPVTCCKAAGSLSTFKPDDANCTLTPTSSNSNIDTSCHEVVQKMIDINSGAVCGIYSAIIVFELICSGVSICLAVRAKYAERKVNPSKNVINVKPSDLQRD